MRFTKTFQSVFTETKQGQSFFMFPCDYSLSAALCPYIVDQWLTYELMLLWWSCEVYNLLRFLPSSRQIK